MVKERVIHPFQDKSAYTLANKATLNTEANLCCQSKMEKQLRQQPKPSIQSPAINEQTLNQNFLKAEPVHINFTNSNWEDTLDFKHKIRNLLSWY
jgi:hypothetical protein